MATYFKEFFSNSDYNSYITGSTVPLPNVSLVGYKEVKFKPIPINAGTIVYWDGSKLKYHPSYETWNSSIGTPVAVVVVPSNHTPDGTVRAMALTGVNADGSAASSNVSMVWGPTGDTSLPLLDKVPTWDNIIGGTIGNSGYGYLSSNNSQGIFTGSTDCLDSSLKYSITYGPFIPNPYLPDGSPNPDYRNIVEATSANCLSDFDGAGNTAVLVGLGTAYTAANACYNYSTSGIPIQIILHQVFLFINGIYLQWVN